MQASRTRIRLCGRLEVEIDGTPVQDGLRGRQGRTLLAFLVLNRARPTRREELVEALWPGGRAPAGGDGLAPLLSRLRSTLGAERLTGRHELQLVLGDDAWVDWEAAHADLAAARTALAGGNARTARDAARAALE